MTTRQQSLLVLLFLPLTVLTGCLRHQAKISGVFHLQNVENYPLLVPSIYAESTNATINLGPLARNSPAQCTINDPVFSLHPPTDIASERWTITGPSSHAWETDGSIDLHTAWAQFTHDLSELYRIGCFNSAFRQSAALRAFAQAIPIPADEVLLFTYSFTGKGAIDLVPGMQIRIEHSILKDTGSDRNAIIAEARYEVVAGPANGVALHLSHTANRRFARQTANIFDLSQTLHSKPMLRLFLQSISYQTAKIAQRNPILLAANTTADLDRVAQQIETDPEHNCPRIAQPAITCISLASSAVSLMISCRINGQSVYEPLGTTLTQIVKDKLEPLQTIVVLRLMVDGTYAQLDFPKTHEGASHIILLSGDHISWQQPPLQSTR